MPLECKQLEKVLLLMKVFLIVFLFITLCIILPIIYLNIKQNLGYTWLLEPYTLGKLIFLIIFLRLDGTLVMLDSLDHMFWVN